MSTRTVNHGMSEAQTERLVMAAMNDREKALLIIIALLVVLLVGFPQW